MKKQILSILLCFCMAISLLPVTALAEGETIDWSAMYASDSVIKPTPSNYTSGNDEVWSAPDGGVKLSNAFSTSGAARYFAAMLDVPDDAYYNLDFTLTGDSSDDAAGSRVGYIVGNSELGPYHDGYEKIMEWSIALTAKTYKEYTGLDNGCADSCGNPESWSLEGLKGTNVQFVYAMLSGSAQSVDNYMVISGVKFTRLTNAVTATPGGDGSGTFDVSSDADLNQTGTDLTSYSADIGRGSQITLTAHPNAGSYFDHWEDSSGTSISTDISITVTVGDSATDDTSRTYNPVFGSGTDPRVAKLLDGNTRNTLTGNSLRITHMGSSWSVPTWGILDSLRSSIESSTSDSDATLNLTLDVTAEDSVFYGLVLPGSSTKGNEANMTITVDGNSTTVGGASSADTTKPYFHSFAIPVTKGTHTVSFQLQNADYTTAYLQGLGLVSGDNRTVTLKATDYADLAGCDSYTVTVNGTDVTDDVKSADGYIAPYGSVAEFEAVNADVSQYSFQNWTTGDYSTTSVIPDVDTVGKGQLVLRGDVTLTPAYTEGIHVASAIMADPTETAPDGGTYQWTMNSAAYFSVNEDGAVAIAEGGVLNLEFTVPEGEIYMSRMQGNCAFKLYKGETELGSYSSTFPTGYCYSVLGAGSYQMVFTGSSTCVLDNFTCQPYGSMGYGKVTVTAEQTDVSGQITDATQALADSGALPAAEYIFCNLDSLGYVADGYTNKVVKTISLNDLNFILDKTKLENAGLSALNADKADNTGLVSFNTSGTTLTIPYSNFLVSNDGSYSYSVHINLQSTGGYPYLSGTTLYANGCPIYVSNDGKVYFYKTDGSHTEPVKNLSTGDAQITLGSGATIYGGSNKADVASTYVSLAYNTAGYTVYGGGNGYGVTGSSEIVCPGGTVNQINGGNNGNGTKPASITVTGSSSKITAANGVTGGSASGDVTVTVLDFEGELTGGSSENGTVTVNAGTTSYSTAITGSVIGVPAGGSAKNVMINAMATVSGSIFGAKTGSNVGNVTINVSGTAEGGAVTGTDNATVTGNVTVHVTAADMGDSTAIYGQSNSTVGGDVAVTVNGGNLYSCKDVYGSSGGTVTGKVTVNTNGKVSAHLLGSRGGSVGSVEVTPGGDVTGSVTGLSGGSAGAVTVTANHNVTDTVCAVLDGSVTGDVSLTVNAQAKSVAAVQAASASASVGGKVTLTMGENAVLTDSTVTVLAPVLSASDSIKATVTGNVTFNHRMNTLADTVTLSDRDEHSVISGTSSLNVYADNGQQIVLRGGNTGSAVNLFTLYTKLVYVPLGGNAPVADSSVTGGYFVKKTSDQSGFDLYSLVNLTKPIVDEGNKRIIGNGFPLKVSSSGVSYFNGSAWVNIATGDLSAYTVYGGAEQVDVQNASITFSGVSAQSPGTYFGGGMNGDVTGAISIKLEGGSSISTDFGRPVTIYGGAQNADVTGNLNVSLNYDEKSSSTNMVTWFAGCKNGDFKGSAQFDIQRDDTYEKDEDDTSTKAFNVFKLPGAFYLCSENGTFAGNIDLCAGAMDYRTDMTGGIHDAYSTTGKSSGYNTIHLLSYTDSTATPITRTSEKTTVTGDNDPNLKSVSWDNGTAVLSYHVVLYIIDEYTTAAEVTDTAEDYILYAAGGLYCDRGAIGEEDSADVLVRGFATQYLHYYFGTDNATLPAGEALTFTMDKAAWVYFYMNGLLTLNLNTSLTGNGLNGVAIGDTTEAVLLTIGRADGGTESYTINSSGLWYSKLVINKPFDSYYGISIKSGNNYNEDDITLNLDKSKYAAEKYTGTFGGTYCKLKSVSTVVVNPEEEPIGRISEGGSKLEGYVLIFDDGGKNYAAVDTDKDGVLDDSEKNTKVEITEYYPDALPDSHITMLSGSLDFFSFYGEAFTQKGGSINTIFFVYPASESATISQNAGCTLEYMTIKSAAETTAYTADPTCVINVEIGGYIKSISSSTAAANVKLLSTANPGSDGTFTFGKDDIFGTLDFSEYTLKHLDETNGYYTDIRYFNQNSPVKPNDPATLKIISDGSYNRYCPESTAGAADIVNVSADFVSVNYGYVASDVAVTLDLSSICPYITGTFSSNFELTYDTASGKVTVKPKSGLEPGIYQESCSIYYNNSSGVSQTLKFPVSITVFPQTVTVTPNDSLVTYSGSGNTGWKQGYTLSPAVTLADADKDLLVYYGEATAGDHELHLSKTRSSDNRYDFVLAAGTYNLTISAYEGNQGYPIESAAATVPETWGTYALITAPEGYLVSLTADGTYTKSVKWNTSSSTQPQNGVTYYIKDNTASHDSYLLSLQKMINGVKVCTDGDLVNYAAGTATTDTTTADVTFTAALKDNAAGACGISEVYVLAVPAGNAAPTVDTVLASGTAATKNSGAYSVTLTGLNANTKYTFYAAHRTEAGVKAPGAANLGNATTLGFAPTVTASPAASGVYGTALSQLPLTGGKVTGQNSATLSGSWTWTETDASAIYPAVNGTAAYEATFTPSDTQYSPVTVSVNPAMTPAQISITGATAQGRSYEKSNTSVTITGASFSDGISLNLGSDFTAVGAMTDTNAGEGKTVNVTVTMINGNYTLSSAAIAATVNISKAGTVTLTDQSVSRRYNLTGEQSISVSGLMPDDAGTLTYAKGTGSGDTAVISDWSVETDGTVKYTLLGGNIGDSVTLPVKINSTNYAESTVNVVITLSNKENQTTPAAFTLQFNLNTDEATYTATIPAIPGAEYSFNGTDWSDVNTKSNIAPNESVTGYIRMKATDDKNASDVTSSTKSAPLLTVKTPVASPNGGTFSGTQTVTLACATSGADVYYTTDGSTPTSGSTKYTAGFTVSDTTTVKAIAVKTGMNSSAVLTITFTKYSRGGFPSGGSSGGGTTAAEITIPVSSNEGSIQAAVTMKNGTATVSMTDAQLQEIALGNETTGTVKIDVSGLKADTVVVSSKIVSAANSASGTTGLEVVLPFGTVTFDKDALASVADKGDLKYSVGAVDNAALTDSQREILGTQADSAVVVDVNVYVNGTKTSTFGDGKIQVSVPYTLKSGERADSITVWFIRDDGTIEPKSGTYHAETGCVEFTTQHLSQYLIVHFPFSDVAKDAWYYGDVAYDYNNGLFSGTSATTFSPDTAMTREMIWMVLARMDGKTPADMDEAKAWAVEHNISDGSNPTDSVTREQMATILYRYAQYKGYDTTQGGMAIREFADYGSISEYALPALVWAVNAGVMQGSDNNIMPQDSATRAQVAAILQRFCQNVVK